jgi:carbon-monoxide dehydrogenase medium subunit
MIPAAFDYHRPQSLQDAVGKLAELGEDAKVLAGGHSLLPLMRLRFAAPSALVDIGYVGELRFVARDGDRIRVGALTRHADLEAHPVIREFVPLLSLTAAEVGDPQIRNRGTIGGSVAHADPAGEYGTVCLMLDAEIVTTKRRIPARDFFLGRFTTPLDHDEIVTELVFPVTGSGAAYTKFCHRLFDWALVGAAAQRTDRGWRVGLVNVSETPVRAVAVERALDAGAPYSEAARLASDGLTPTPSLRASAEYKLHLTRVLTRRVVEEAAAHHRSRHPALS